MRCLISMVLLLLQGCADMGYYWHSASGHLEIMSERVDIDALLTDESTETALQQRLQLVQDIRRFSVERLALPDNDSYQSFVQLDRPYVLQNLFASAEFSTRLYQWCYPVIGCASYRGYYDEQRLRDYIEQLEAEGYEVYIGQVSAYSTLGWFDDPVLSSFIDWPEYRLAGLLFHELTHQRVFVDDDTTFNESLATSVQQAGTRLWLESRGQTEQLERLERWSRYRSDAVGLITATRARLERLYRLDIADEDKRQRKQDIFDEAGLEHAALAQSHGIQGGYTRWFATGLNNAKIGSVSAYTLHVESFLQMLRAHADDFAAFYRYVDRLANLEREPRNACLEAWSAGSGDIDPVCPALARISHRFSSRGRRKDAAASRTDQRSAKA